MSVTNDLKVVSYILIDTGPKRNFWQEGKILLMSVTNDLKVVSFYNCNNGWSIFQEVCSMSDFPVCVELSDMMISVLPRLLYL